MSGDLVGTTKDSAAGVFRHRGHPALRYASAIPAIAIAILSWQLPPLASSVHLHLATCFIAVIIVAWYSGLGPGLLAVVLGAFATYLFTSAAALSTAPNEPNLNLLGLALYGVMSVAVVVFSDARHRARRLADASARALSENNQWLSTILMSINDGVIVTDTRGRVTLMNTRAEEMCGRSLVQAKGRQLEQVFTFIAIGPGQADQPETTAVDGARSVTEGILLSAEKLEKPLIESRATLKDSVGHTTGTVHVFHDIQKRKAMEDALRRSEGTFRALFDYDVVPFCLWHADGRILDANDAELKLLGYSREELTRGELRWDKLTPPDWQAQDAKATEEIIRTGRFSPVEREIYHHDGHRIPVLIGGSTIPGEPDRGVSFIVDLTERKRAEDALKFQEEQLRLVIDGVPALISYIDSDQRCQFANKAYEEWFGVSPEELRGKHLKEILGHDAYEGIRQNIEKVLSGEKVSFSTWIDYKAVGKRHVQINYVPHLDKRGDVRGYLALILDLSERKRAEDALRESEELNRAILSSLDTHVAVLDRRGTIISVNSSWNDFAQANGVANKNSIAAGVNYLEACQKAVRAGDAVAREACDGIKAVCEGSRESFQMEYPCHAPDAQRWFHMLVTPLKRTEGGAVVAHTDVTERQRAEEALRQSKERFQQLVETTNVIGWEADLETWMFTYVSPQATKLLGYEPHEWYEKDFWIRHLHPDDREFAVNFCAQSSRNLREYEFEYRMIAADGHTVWIRDLVSVIGEPTPRTLRGYLIDITDRKKAEALLQDSEERLRNLLENIPDHVLTLDRRGTVLYINHAAPGFVEEEVVGKPLSDLLHPESRAVSERCIEDAFQSGKACDLEASDINSRSYRIRYVPFTREGEVSSLLVVATDMTEQKRAEKTRRQLAERLEFAREDERRLLARQLHDEAGQDLSAAAIYLERLGLKLSELLDKEDALRENFAKVEQLLQLTQETLRQTARALHPSILEHYGLVTALRSFTQELGTLSQRSGVVFQMDVSPGFPRLDRMVETTAYRVAQEAITNAFRHAQAQRITIKLSVKGNLATVVVEDDGRGINGSASESHGIGLANMYERAELIGANIDIWTKPMKGTRLTLTIPVSEAVQTSNLAATADSHSNETQVVQRNAHDDSYS